jgi:hypothetical protein
VEEAINKMEQKMKIMLSGKISSKRQMEFCVQEQRRDEG